MVRSHDELDMDAIANCLVDTLSYLKFASECMELMTLMLELSENPSLGTPRRMQVLAESCLSLWEDVDSNTTMGLRRVRKMLQAAVPDTEEPWEKWLSEREQDGTGGTEG